MFIFSRAILSGIVLADTYIRKTIRIMTSKELNSSNDKQMQDMGMLK
jgi:hypothetical protein